MTRFGFTRTPRWALSLALTSAVAPTLVAGCGNSNTTTTPAGGSVDDASTSTGPAVSADSDAAAVSVASSSDASAPSAPVDDGPDDSMCGGADVDLAAVLANRKCRTRRDAPAGPAGWASFVKVALKSSADKVAPGGHVDLTLEVTNTGTVAVPLYFGGDLSLTPSVVDAKGAKIAPPAGNAPKNPDPKCLQEVGCKNPTSHAVLPPGAKAHATISWEASKVAWPKTGPTACCATHVDSVSAGPLAPGAYKIKLPLPFEAAQGNPADPEIVVRVAK